MINQNQNNIDHNKRINVLLGSTLLTIGAVVLLEQFLGTGWLVWATTAMTGVVFLIEGMRNRKIGWLISGSLLFGASAGMLLGFGRYMDNETPHRIGILLLSIAFGFGLITAGSAVSGSKLARWPLIPGGILVSLGLCFLLSDLSLLAFVLYLCIGIGVVLLLWGVFCKLFGLIIPGSLLITIGPGIYIAWGTSVATNPLAKIGLMIAAFSFGWGLIVFFARVISAKFVWWPLIPGGVLAMVGLGLYIGGDPAGAPSFISNTGSVAIIIFGLYLLLLRKGIHH